MKSISKIDALKYIFIGMCLLRFLSLILDIKYSNIQGRITDLI